MQALLRSGDFDIDCLRPANRDVLKDMRLQRWSTLDVLQIISNLLSKDFRKSEWARIDGGCRWVPCDVYCTFYDRLKRRRLGSALPVYLKFSIDQDGGVVILVASCHESS